MCRQETISLLETTVQKTSAKPAESIGEEQKKASKPDVTKSFPQQLYREQSRSEIHFFADPEIQTEM